MDGGSLFSLPMNHREEYGDILSGGYHPAFNRKASIGWVRGFFRPAGCCVVSPAFGVDDCQCLLFRVGTCAGSRFSPRTPAARRASAAPQSQGGVWCSNRVPNVLNGLAGGHRPGMLVHSYPGASRPLAPRVRHIITRLGWTAARACVCLFMAGLVVFFHGGLWNRSSRVPTGVPASK